MPVASLSVAGGRRLPAGALLGFLLSCCLGAGCTVHGAAHGMRVHDTRSQKLHVAHRIIAEVVRWAPLGLSVRQRHRMHTI